jgi:hypothetical protein
MKVKIITGTKINKIRRKIGTIKKMNQKGVILTPAVKVLKKWNIAQYIKFEYYRITKWDKPH